MKKHFIIFVIALLSLCSCEKINANRELRINEKNIEGIWQMVKIEEQYYKLTEGWTLSSVEEEDWQNENFFKYFFEGSIYEDNYANPNEWNWRLWFQYKIVEEGGRYTIFTRDGVPYNPSLDIEKLTPTTLVLKEYNYFTDTSTSKRVTYLTFRKYNSGKSL